MEFTKDIYFNDSLKNGQTATITYVGELFKNGSENVNLVCGFGENWDFTSTIPMSKTENGFTANIQMKDFDTFNFCFSNEYNVWDNNNSFNYVSPILPEVKEFKFDFEFESLEEFMNGSNTENDEDTKSIDDIIDNILGNTVQNSIANTKNDIDYIPENATIQAMPEIEALFNELFSEDNNNNINVISSQETNDFEIKNKDQLIQLFDELFGDDEVEYVIEDEEKIESEPTVFNPAQFNLDGLVSELLDPVISASANITPEQSLFDNIEDVTIPEETALMAVKNELQVSSRRLGYFYRVKKRIMLACYKLFIKAPKAIAKQLGFSNDQ